MSKLQQLTESVQITPPDMRTTQVRIIGTAPLMVARFSQKAMLQMTEKHKLGAAAKKGKAKEPRDFDADFEGCRHISEDGWDGVHAGAFRKAMISACRLVGFQMTLAKLSLFVEADGFDRVDGVPLIRIIGAEPEKNMMYVRNATGVVDLRVRPMWRRWACDLRVRYDAGQFGLQDALNLLSRAGEQVGIGEGRPDSKASAGMGIGTFRLETESEHARTAAV